MKLKHKLFNLFIYVFMCVQLSAQNTNPEVTNVAFAISGTTVTVTYNVSDAEQNTVTIMMEVSSDGGTTWDWNYGATSGDIGTGVSTGTGKTITWTYNGGFEENFKMKIIANDEIADGSPCPGTPTVEYSGKTYNTIQIGDQCWLKENLDVGTRIIGNVDQTNNEIIEKYCPNNLDANCTTYGGLFQWDEAMQYSTTEGAQGICPPGWHIPTIDELQTLTSVSNDGNSLKAIGQGSGAGAGTNTSGFSALLAGYCNDPGSFFGLDGSGFFWSSTETDTPGATNVNLYFANSNIYIEYIGKDYGFSVRCVKD